MNPADALTVDVGVGLVFVTVTLVLSEMVTVNVVDANAVRVIVRACVVVGALLTSVLT